MEKQVDHSGYQEQRHAAAVNATVDRYAGQRAGRVGSTRKAGTVIVNCHSDDAAIAATCMLKREVFEKPVVLLTLFTRSSHVVESYEPARPTIAEVTIARHQELQGFCRTFGLIEKSLGFFDLNDRVACAASDDVLVAEIAEGIITTVDRSRVRCIVAPFVNLINHTHVDHILLGRAMSRVIDATDVPIVYVDDSVYGTVPVSPQCRIAGRTYRHANCRFSKKEFSWKVDFLRCTFPSQYRRRFSRVLSKRRDDDGFYHESILVPEELWDSEAIKLVAA